MGRDIAKPRHGILKQLKKEKIRKWAARMRKSKVRREVYEERERVRVREG